jgi:hypothetical protein
VNFFDKNGQIINIWLPVIGGPIVAIITFTLSYWIDPLSLQETKAIAAFFFSMVMLMIGQWLVTITELQKSAKYSDRLYDAIKNYLHITRIGSPETAFGYINSRLPILSEVKNTRLNTIEEIERANEKLYESSVFDRLIRDIPLYCRDTLIWKDLGDQAAITGLRDLHQRVIGTNVSKSSRYKFKLLTHLEPQINFILLEYKSGEKEVLFNWDFRSNGQDPVVLLSRDSHIVEMFTVHFYMLWRAAVDDHDSHATISTSTK